MYDAFFIIYNEPDYAKNWEILKRKFPMATMLYGIKGIHNAHKEAAKKSFTKMFWVIDADAEIVEDFDFDYEVPEYDLDNVHIWHSRNPVNDLEYGYGGIKLLPKSLVLDSSTDSVDMATSISKKIKVIEKVSNITKFNTDEFNSWKSAFRECAKLSSNIINNSDSKTSERLEAWCTIGADRPYGEYVLRGAQLGKIYGYQNRNNIDALKKINDFDWLKIIFEENKDKNISTKSLLNEIGTGMCLAKWTQTTIHLGLGQTHSCHHPKTHVIPISEIKKNSGALHNTEFKKSVRKEMLEGKRPSECNYCWNVEDLNKENVFSDRILKSSEIWSLPYYNEVLNSKHTDDFDPRYLEISFSNVCNFKCSYCMPSVSSKWMEEIEKYGPYPTSRKYNSLEWEKEDGRIPIANKEENPYIDAFWDWFPNVYKNLHTFRLTGGEPLLDKNTFRVLDYLIENPNPNIEISVNTNLCVPDALFDNFIKKVKIISENRLVKKFLVYTSCEAHGSAAEYIRYGLNYNQWVENFCRYVEEVPGSQVSVMATYNALSVGSFERFLKDFHRINCFSILRKDSMGNNSYAMIDIPYLNNPAHQSVKILTKEFLPLIDSQISYMEFISKKFNGVEPGFKVSEIAKLKRIKNLLEEELKNPTIDTQTRRKDFAIFVDEHDKRRGTNFLETFPEMEEFYNFCKSLS
jgi:organic radical activating enzyme